MPPAGMEQGKFHGGAIKNNSFRRKLDIMKKPNFFHIASIVVGKIDRLRNFHICFKHCFSRVFHHSTNEITATRPEQIRRFIEKLATTFKGIFFHSSAALIVVARAVSMWALSAKACI